MNFGLCGTRARVYRYTRFGDAIPSAHQRGESLQSTHVVQAVQEHGGSMDARACSNHFVPDSIDSGLE